MLAVYGAAEFVEGNNKYKLGEEGNLTDKAWNPVKDTVFAGNRTLYDQYGTISTIVVMIVAPYAAGARAAAGVVGQAAARSVLINEAGRVVFSYATGAVGGYVGNVAGTHFFGANVGRYWGLVGGIVGGAVGYKIAPKVFNALDNIHFNRHIDGIPKHSLSDVDARKWYLDQERNIPSQIDKSVPLEEQAKQTFNLRNQYRTQARELMADKALAKSLNMTEPNLTWTEILQKQTAKGLEGNDIYIGIIESSQRSRPSVNYTLGLR